MELGSFTAPARAVAVLAVMLPWFLGAAPAETTTVVRGASATTANAGRFLDDTKVHLVRLTGVVRG